MTRIASLALSLLVTSTVTTTCTRGFAFPRQHRRPKPRHRTTTSTIASSSTALRAVGVFVRKAKEAGVRKYCEEGPSDSVLAGVCSEGETTGRIDFTFCYFPISGTKVREFK